MDTRQKIVEAAFATFYEQGFHACGVELLAQQAGITKRTLYAHFGSKEGLIEAVLQYRHHTFITRLQAILAQQPPQQAASAYLDFIADWTRAPDFHGCLFINACAEHSQPASLPNRLAAAQKQDIRRILRTRLEEAGVANAAVLADTAYLLGEGLIVAAQTGQHDLAIDPRRWETFAAQAQNA